MVKVVHEVGKRRVEGEASGFAAGMFLLTDKEGSFFSQSPGEQVTKYSGLITYDAKRFFKSVERICLSDEVLVVKNLLCAVERSYKHGAVERFSFQPGSFRYELSGHTGTLALELDMRHLTDERTDGRFYTARQLADTLVVRYEKFTDGTRTEKEYERFLVVKGLPHGAFDAVGSWREQRYPYDERRGDSSDLWIYQAGTLRVNGPLTLHIAVGQSEKEALVRLARAVSEQKQASSSQSAEERLSFAALDALITTLPGERHPSILAGLPWFTQTWSRDELISLGALLNARHIDFVKHVLLRYYLLLESREHFDALYPSGGLAAADALGWLAKRTLDLLALQEAHHHFKRSELHFMRERMSAAIRRREKAADADCLITNGAGETWMDAPVAGDTRAGGRLEIQALQLCGYRLCALLDKLLGSRSQTDWAHRERVFAQTARSVLFRDKALLDGIENGIPDLTVRPNIFLAYYLYPKLLTPAQWRDAFGSALPRLWLDWGGLSSIDTKSPLFTPRYAGMRNNSYHRGDSWYWLNALAAICLQQLDARQYRVEIAKLRAACITDLLFQGAIGHCSELSSAAEQEWGGCFAQAWSAAMLYELLIDCRDRAS
jgi:hypothetical protein